MPLPLLAIPASLGGWWTMVLLLIGPIVFQVVMALGVGWATYSVTQLGTDKILTYVQSQTASIPIDMLSIVALLHMDTAVSIIATAYSVRATLAGWRYYQGRHHRRTTVWNKPGNQDLPA